MTTPRSWIPPAGPAARQAAGAALLLGLLLGAANPSWAAMSGMTMNGGTMSGGGTAEGLSLTDGWMRIVIPERPAAGYFTLKNESAEPRELTGAASPDCGMVMLHQSRAHDGVDTMAMVAEVTIPAHGSATFAPGGYHLMCLHPSSAMKPGGHIPMILRFKDGTSLKADFAVRNATGK